jgi:hypothetical protein
MEFFRHQGGNMKDVDTGTLLVPPQADWNWVRGLAENPRLLPRVELENEAMRRYIQAAVLDRQDYRVEAARRSRGTEFHLYGLGCASEQLQFLRDASDVSSAQAEDHAGRCAALRGSP